MFSPKTLLLFAIFVPSVFIANISASVAQEATATANTGVDPGFGVDPELPGVDPDFGVTPLPGAGVDPGFGVDPKADIEEKNLTTWPVVIKESGDNLIQMEKANAGDKAVNLVFQGMGGDASQSFAYDNVPAGAYPVINVKINSIRASSGGVIDITGLGTKPYTGEDSEAGPIYNVNIVNDITSPADTALRFIDGFQSGDGGRTNIRIWKNVTITGSPINNNGTLQLQSQSKSRASNQADLLLERGSVVHSTDGPALKLSNADNFSSVDLSLTLDPNSVLSGTGENAIDMTYGIRHQLSVKLNSNAKLIGDIQYGFTSNPEEGVIELGNEGVFDSAIKGENILGQLADANIRLVKSGSGLWRLNKQNYYTGNTKIKNGNLKLGHAKAIPVDSKTIINNGGTLTLSYRSPEIADINLNSGDLAGAPLDVFKQSARIRHGALTGTITSKGGVLENIYGEDATLNVVSGRTLIEGMEGYGSDTDVSLGTVNVNGGQLWAQDENKLSAVNKISELTLNTLTNKNPNAADVGGLPSEAQDGLVLGLGVNKRPALTVTDTFTYNSGNIYLYAPNSIDPSDYQGDWKVLDFSSDDLTAEKYREMFSNTYLMVEDAEGNIGYYQFNEDGAINPVNNTTQLLRPISVEKGSLVLKVGEVDLGDNQQNNDSNSGDGNTLGSNNSGGESLEEEIEDEIVDEILTGNDNLATEENQDGDSTADGGGTIDFEDNLLEDIVIENGLWTKRDLVEIVKRGLLPRNIDGAGQSLANFNNLLTDTIFERTPMRQFKEVDVAVVQPTAELEVEPSIEPSQEPVRGLWSKSSEIDDQKADAYLDQTTKPMVIADAHTAAEHQDETIITINGITYEENKSLTAEYADRDGVRGWFRGFGGRSGDYNGESDTLFNRYSISGGGGVLGADVSISESFQLGAYANYGNISLTQRNGIEGLGGGWNADGWGGGITADYSTNNFYVQGLLGATGFSGQQRRNIKEYGSLFDAQTAKGEKSATSMLGALRIGAPMQSGNTYIEPQFTASWTGNNENSFSESTDNSALGLSYKQRNTNYLQTALGVKFAWPIDTGTTGLMTPSIRVGWLADWNMGNESQTIGLDFTDKTYSISSNQENQNGALIEAGLDYSVAQVQSTTVKAYLRGGAEVWGGNRGTNWRASGGMTFQF